jgi:tripartite-type tricarboxylate transporter receptor subunit TctC
VPTLKEATGSDWATGAWRGIAAPKGLRPAVAARLEASVKKAYDSKEYKDFMAQRGFGMLWGTGKDFAPSWPSPTPT